MVVIASNHKRGRRQYSDIICSLFAVPVLQRAGYTRYALAMGEYVVEITCKALPSSYKVA